jgi:CheY-like chemotaxis protein
MPLEGTMSDLQLKGIRALVIDEDPGARTALAKRLTDWGAEAAEAHVAASALAEIVRARAQGQPFGLIFLASSSGAGLEVAERLRAQPSELERTILLLHPERADDELRRAQQVGIRSYVSKPFGEAAIRAAICGALGIEEPRQTVAPREGQRARILLAEDNRDAAWILRTQIEGPEYQVDVAADGSVAVNLFRLASWDLVLMDIQMPNFDGYWATREIREWERANRLKRTPIVALTAFAEQEDPQKSLRAGLDGYLVKPIEKERLRSAIRRYLRRP